MSTSSATPAVPVLAPEILEAIRVLRRAQIEQLELQADERPSLATLTPTGCFLGAARAYSQLALAPSKLLDREEQAALTPEERSFLLGQCAKGANAFLLLYARFAKDSGGRSVRLGETEDR